MKIVIKNIAGTAEPRENRIKTVDRIVQDSRLGKVYVCKELYKPHKNIPYIIMECFVEEVIED